MGNKRSSNKRKSSALEPPSPSSSDAGFPGNGSSKTEPERSPAKKKHSVWSKECELALLKLIIRFNGQSASDGASFTKKDLLAFIAKSLEGVFTVSQVNEKIKRMKRKYRLSDGGNENPPSDPTEREIVDLATKLWIPIRSNGVVFVKEEENGSQEIDPEEERTEKVDLDFGASDDPRDKRTEKADLDLGASDDPKEKYRDKTDFDFGASDFGNGLDFFAGARDLIPNVGTNGELERLKKEIRVSEIELFMKKTELLKQQLLLALEASKPSSGDKWSITPVKEDGFYNIPC